MKINGVDFYRLLEKYKVYGRLLCGWVLTGHEVPEVLYASETRGREDK